MITQSDVLIIWVGVAGPLVLLLAYLASRFDWEPGSALGAIGGAAMWPVVVFCLAVCAPFAIVIGGPIAAAFWLGDRHRRPMGSVTVTVENKTENCLAALRRGIAAVKRKEERHKKDP